MSPYNENIAVLITRIILGLLFFIQGYDKVFHIKLAEVIRTFKFELKRPGIPDSMFSLSAYYTCYVELIGGFMLLVGFMKYWVLYALGLDLILVALAMSMIRPMWDMGLVFPRLVLLLLLLMLPSSWDIFSVDYLLFFKQ